MAVITTEAVERRAQFFKLVFRDISGFVCLASREGGTNKFTEGFFKWPQHSAELEQFITKHSSHNLYFCPHLFEKPRRTKDYVSYTPCAWADLDLCAPENLLVQPTITVETSPARFQALWIFKDMVAPFDAEDVSRRIAYAHEADGADSSGWDLTQLLRVPDTNNYKYGFVAAAPTVKIVSAVNVTYTVEEFNCYPQAEGYEHVQIPMPPLDELPEPDDVLMHRRHELHPHTWFLYSSKPKADWSKPLWQLQLLLLESGCSREETFAIARAAACNKYARDGRPEILLWKEVCRATQKMEERQRVFGPITKDLAPLLSDADRKAVETSTSFVEDYVEWAKTTGDAAWQYHQVGAFVVLSTLLAGTVRLPTSFGVVTPNVWFMILADTTLTRKTTAMDLAVDLINEIDADAILATDGSIEGLFTSLSMRPGRSSVFLRDEFSGLLDAINRKDYYAGMAETLTKLYDGKFQKRVLRKETIEVRDPVLIFFAGGIKQRVESLLQYEHVASGFIPRFVMISAESDVASLKPLGPPTDANLERRGQLLIRLAKLTDRFGSKSTTVSVNGHVSSGPNHKMVTLTPDAWLLYNRMESEMLEASLLSNFKDTMTPCFDRLSKSGLKMSVLLAAARAATDDIPTIVVREEDVMRAFYYIEQWRLHTLEIIRNVGKTSSEQQIGRVLEAIKKEPGILRSQLMVRWHLTKRDADNIFETLDQRGEIVLVKSGKSQRAYPVEGGG